MHTRLPAMLIIALMLLLPSAAAAQSLTSRTDSAWSYVNRANDWYLRGEFERALSDYTLAISFDPHLAWAYLNRAIVRSAKGDRELALADCNRALELDPRLPAGWSLRS